jgi:hypothetical protein
LTSAIGLARLYEARQSAITRSNQSEGRKAAIGSWQSATQPFMPIKRLTPKELKERQAKGLCFKCNDKYGPGHRCKRLFMIEAYLEEEEDGEQVMGEEESGPTEPPEISLHAITGTKVPEGEQP